MRMALIERSVTSDLWLASPQPGLRVRHVRKAGDDYYLLFNESSAPVSTGVRFGSSGSPARVDTATGAESQNTSPMALELAAYEMALIRIPATGQPN